jgi:hypothetical protein
MGFSHAVFIAQCAHESILYRYGALRKEDSLLLLLSSEVTHTQVIHGIVIDDFFLFCLSRRLALETIERVLEAYRLAGFVVKQSKVVMPTSEPVKIIGFDIDGARATICLPAGSQLTLMQSTLAVLRLTTVTGSMLSHYRRTMDLGDDASSLFSRRSSACLSLLSGCSASSFHAVARCS